MSIPFRAVVPFLHVKDVPASIAFYERLGFRLGNTHAPEGSTETVWAWLSAERSGLMVAKASEPVIAEQQAVMFWFYVDDVPAKHAELTAAGFEVSEIQNPFWNPHGEFRLKDPDGYDIFIAHT